LRVMDWRILSVTKTGDFHRQLCDHVRMDVTQYCEDGDCRSCAGCQHECHPRDVRASHGALLGVPEGWRDLVRRELVGVR